MARSAIQNSGSSKGERGTVADCATWRRHISIYDDMLMPIPESTCSAVSRTIGSIERLFPPRDTSLLENSDMIDALLLVLYNLNDSSVVKPAEGKEADGSFPRRMVCRLAPLSVRARAAHIEVSGRAGAGFFITSKALPDMLVGSRRGNIASGACVRESTTSITASTRTRKRLSVTHKVLLP